MRLKFVSEITLIIRDLIQGYLKLKRMGFGEEVNDDGLHSKNVN